MKYIKEYRLCCLLCLAGIVCISSYYYVGSYVDENGMLIEPFVFIPMFWLFEFLAVVIFAICLVMKSTHDKTDGLKLRRNNHR